ncbi:MAG: hypothetical protein HY545_02660, partial [Candidatus Doudnabacteria bacterium]|nr:hypothetical protein [Candidatus Doudnabacteria bacterium]
MKKFFEALEKQQFTLTGWLAAAFGIVLIRAVLENFFNGTINGYPTADATTLVHFYLWYIAVVACLIFCIKFVVNKPLPHLANIGLFGLIFIWIAPIVDLASGARSHLMSYIYSAFPEIIRSYSTYFQDQGSAGITTGIRIEIAVILVLIGSYIYVNQTGLWSRIFKTFLGICASYTVIFAWLAFPGIISIFANQQEGLSFFTSSVVNSAAYLSSKNPNIIYALITVMSQLIYLALFLLAGIWLWVSNKRHLIELLKNSRWPRLIYFLLIFALGLFLTQADLRIQNNWIHVLYLLTATITIYCFWMFSVGSNDLTDLE